MSCPLLCHPDKVVLLPPVLFPCTDYYRCMAKYGRAVIDTSMRYDKRRKEVHRYDIADTRGRLSLTVPVSRPAGAFVAGNLCWNQVTVSDHGRWWEVHRIALESAYGRTPFFEFYIDRFAPLFSPEPRPVTDMVVEADVLIRDILGLEVQMLADVPEGCVTDDFRRQLPVFDERPYWQVRQQQLGFVSGLSVLDLIFNLGPEAPLFLF